jgi:hypothetical protein
MAKEAERGKRDNHGGTEKRRKRREEMENWKKF